MCRDILFALALSAWPFALSPLLSYFPPLKINQSCEEVPMKTNIGSYSQALVREAIKA